MNLRMLAVGAATGALAFSAASAATAEPEIEIKDAVARVVVVTEPGRTQIDVRVQNGRADLPALEVRRQGDKVIVDGDLDRRIGSCMQTGVVLNDHARPIDPPENLTVDVRGTGRVKLADAPLVTVYAPTTVEVSAGGAVFGSIGRTDKLQLSNAGCGDWTVANVAGEFDVAIAGSGDVRAGTAQDLEVSIAGSGDFRGVGARGLKASIAGSGDAIVGRVDGPVKVAIAGSGDVRIEGGAAPSLEVSTAGSGDTVFDGRAGDVNVSIIGSGDVRVASATGQVRRSVMGSGDVVVGGR